MTMRTCSRSAACAEERPIRSAVASKKVLIECDIERSFLDGRGTPTDAMPRLRPRIGERQHNIPVSCGFPFAGLCSDGDNSGIGVVKPSEPTARISLANDAPDSAVSRGVSVWLI